MLKPILEGGYAPPLGDGVHTECHEYEREHAGNDPAIGERPMDPMVYQ
jgi:hypothetical protein